MADAIDDINDFDDDEFNDLELDASVLNQLDQIEQISANTQQPAAASTAPASSGNAAVRGVARQMTLFGAPASNNASRSLINATPSSSAKSIASQSSLFSSTKSNNLNSFICQAPTKQWDRGVFLEREYSKNPARAISADYEDPMQYGDLFVGSRRANDIEKRNKFALPPPPSRRELPEIAPRILQIDRNEAETWIYPTNMEKRNYQYNIVQKALFNNVLVALPTGLGKTFIAAVVILNFFRWYPDGKILFLAPSRPLVDQQKVACHGICGLPWDCAVDLTGSTAKAKRHDLYLSKRIFYMTPQTLENDILNKSCDPREVVCVVVDEAHKAKGKYAYGNVIARLMEVNPFFRVLALSATPGKDGEAVQEVVDQLHINKIEIRTEEAMDVSPYVFRKREECINVPLGRDLNIIKDKWSKLMRTKLDPLVAAGLIRSQEPMFIHPYAISAINGDKSRKYILDAKPHLRNNIAELSKMARSMSYLMEQSVSMFYSSLRERAMGVNDKGKKASTRKEQIYSRSNTTYQEIMQSLEEMQDGKGRIMHPKMQALKKVLMDHFDQHTILALQNAESVEVSGRDVHGGTPPKCSQSGTRAMVFCSFRECCIEIVDFFNEGGLRAALFVGQGRDKNGNKGMTQKEQDATVQAFKQGSFDVLVATQIGEEGLDIGSVDIIVCYEAVKDSVRMLQRIGRTGRKRDGKVVVLASEGREAQNWQHSKDNYKAVQKEVESLRHVALFDDVERMVPDDIHPKPEFKKVDQPAFDPSLVSDGKTPAAAKSKAKAAPKAKKDPKRNMPQGTLTGFTKASALRVRRGSMDSMSSDSDHDNVVRTRKVPTETHSQRLRRVLEQSSDEDEDKENKSLDEDYGSRSAEKRPSSGTSQRRQAPSFRSLELASSSSRSVNESKKLGVQTRRKTSQSATLSTIPNLAPKQVDATPARQASSVASLRPDDDFDLSIDFVVDRSMEAALQIAETAAFNKTEPDITPFELSPSCSPVQSRVAKVHPLIAQIEAEERRANGKLFFGSEDTDDDAMDAEQDVMDAVKKVTPIKTLMGPPTSVSRASDKSVRTRDDLTADDHDSSSPIKAVPQRRVRRNLVAQPTTPSPTKPTKGRSLKRGRTLTVDDEEDGDNIVNSICNAADKSKARSGQEKRGTSLNAKAQKRKITNSPRSRALFQYEADRSTDEEVHGQRDENDSGLGSSAEDDDDRAAVGDFMPTQAPRGYNQQSIYLQSMLSQAPPEFQRPKRAPFPTISSRFVSTSDDEGPGIRHPRIPSSASRGNHGDMDRYSEDSFVVNDAEEIVWDSDPDSLPSSVL